ncbi:MAG: hypothetical protein RIC15_09145 [Vicingaceae bacterium]
MELNDEVRDFLFSGQDKVATYSHRTGSKEIAQKIVSEGFKFWDSFQKTSDEVINDMVYLRYWDSLRKHYGGYVVIIAISKELVQKIQASIHPKYETQQALSDKLDETDIENSDENLFLLPRQYIKGFIDRENGNIKSNDAFDPFYEPEDIDQRIKNLMQ